MKLALQVITGGSLVIRLYMRLFLMKVFTSVYKHDIIIGSRTCPDLPPAAGYLIKI